MKTETQNTHAPHHGDRFGNWRFDARYGQPSIDYVGPVGLYHGYTQANPYWIRLSALKTEAGLGHWISHLETKDWWYEGTNGADFVRAALSLCADGYVYRGRHYKV